MTTLRLRSMLPLTLAVALLAPPGTTGWLAVREASADDTAKARTAFNEGLQLEAGGNYTGALAKFNEVAQIRRTPPVVYHIALCQEKLGQLVVALGGYRIVIAEGGDDPKNAKVVQAANEALVALEKRVPSLTIKLAKGSDLAKVSIDGVPVGSSTIGKPQQVDPGPHSVEATQSGKLPYKEVVQVAEGESKSVDVSLKDRPAEAVPMTSSSAAGAGTVAPPPTGTGDTAGKRPIVPFVVAGAGVVSLIASGIFYGLRSGAISDLDTACRGNLCPESAKSDSDRGKTMTTLGNVTLGLGLVGIGVGTVLFFTMKPRPAEATTARSVDLVLRPGPGGAAASLVGRF